MESIPQSLKMLILIKNFFVLAFLTSVMGARVNMTFF